MDVRPIAYGLTTYTVLAGAITVGCIYFLTHSGLYMVAATGVGVLLVALGGAASGPVGASAVEGAGDGGISETDDGGISGMIVEDMQLHPSPREFGTRAVLLFYGFGLVLWSAIILAFFRSGLQ
jgi:hypothetical protein